MSSTTIADKPIPLSEPVLESNVWTYVKDALDSGWVSSLGPYVDKFEANMAEYFGVPRTLATVNGTAALHIALLLAGVQPDDEVIVPSMTFIATLNAIRYAQANPVFWDSQATHWNADVAELESLITPKTKAIMVVHLYGDAVDMGPVMALANRYNIPVIEDAAEALGAYWSGKPCGSMGTIGCLSFNGNKTMTTGGGGLLISPDESLMKRAHYLINQAKDDALTFTHHEIGYNYRLTNIQAAMGVAQLESLPGFLVHKRELFDRYDRAFVNHPALEVVRPLPDSIRSCWLYGLRLKPEALGTRTSLDLVHQLQPLNIQTRPFFRPGHQQKPFQSFVTRSLPNADAWQAQGINLPSSPSLSFADQDRVIEAVLSALKSWH